MTMRIRWVLGMCLLWATPAAAQDGECETDSDCGQGMACQLVSTGACATPDCADGDCGDPPPCEATSYGVCVPGPCQTDFDCGGDMVCHTETYEECDGGVACEESPEGEVICPPEPEVPECTSVSESRCVPRWALPCEAATDCGAGFDCKESESCWCSGGGGVPACEPGGECPEPEPQPEPECGCEPTGDFYCVLTEAPCESDAECTGDLVCGSYGETATCGGADPAPDGGSGDPGGGDPDCGVQEPSMNCMPADYQAYGYGYGYDYDYGGSGRGGVATSEDDGGEQGSDNGGNSFTNTATDGDFTGDGGDASVGLCSVGVTGGQGGTAPAGLLLGLGAMWWMRRRRGGQLRG